MSDGSVGSLISIHQINLSKHLTTQETSLEIPDSEVHISNTDRKLDIYMKVLADQLYQLGWQLVMAFPSTISLHLPTSSLDYSVPNSVVG